MTFFEFIPCCYWNSSHYGMGIFSNSEKLMGKGGFAGIKIKKKEDNPVVNCD